MLLEDCSDRRPDGLTCGGRLAALRPRGDADGLIAATAIVHDLIIVTRNVVDFDDTGATVINPWEAGEGP